MSSRMGLRGTGRRGLTRPCRKRLRIPGRKGIDKAL